MRNYMLCGAVGFLLVSVLLSAGAGAETIVLKSGEKVEGKIVERNDKYIKVGMNDMTLTYFTDDISGVEPEEQVSAVESPNISDKPLHELINVPEPSAGIPELAVQPASAVSQEPNNVPQDLAGAGEEMPDALVQEGQDEAAAEDIQSSAETGSSESKAEEFFRAGDNNIQAARVHAAKDKLAASLAAKQQVVRAGKQSYPLDGAQAGLFAGLGIGFISVAFTVIIALYAFCAFCVLRLAKKTQTANGWFAWVPVLNIILTCDIAQKPRWWAALYLLSFIPIAGPIANIVITAFIFMKISERMSKPPWLGILAALPVVNIFIFAYLAFAE